jgi:hypothetical protein
MAVDRNNGQFRSHPLSFADPAFGQIKSFCTRCCQSMHRSFAPRCLCLDIETAATAISPARNSPAGSNVTSGTCCCRP